MRQPDESWTLPLMDRIFRALDAHGVRWAMLRGWSDLASSARDVDLLVDPEDLGRFELVVQQLGGVPLPAWLQGWHRFYWFRHRGLTRPGLMLDVVTGLTYGKGGWHRTELGPVALERRVREGTRYQLAPTDAFWTILLHCLLDKGAVSPRRAEELIAALPGLERRSVAEAAVRNLCPPDAGPDYLIGCVQQQDWEAVSDLGRSLTPADLGQRSDTASPYGQQRRGLWVALQKRLPRRNGLAGNGAKTVYAWGWRAVHRNRKNA